VSPTGFHRISGHDPETVAAVRREGYAAPP
jgi:hypothetical protein